MALTLTLTKPAGTSTTSAKISVAEITNGTAGTYTEVLGLQEIPELGGDPEKIDTTTLADTVKTSIPGVQDLGDLAFTFLYSKANYLALTNSSTGLKSDVGYSWKVEFSDGLTATFTAIPNIKLGGGGVNTAVNFTINMSLQSAIAFSDGSSND